MNISEYLKKIETKSKFKKFLINLKERINKIIHWVLNPEGE